MDELIGIKKDGKMDFVFSKRFAKDKKEEDLHNLIKENPKLIFSGLSEEDVILLGSKVTLPSGKIPDLLFTNPSGDIFIVELKRDKSPREALVQLLDYQSSIRKMDKTNFFNLSVEKLEELIKKLGPDLDSGDFEHNFEKSMKNPILLLVSYEIGEDVKRIADSLRDQKIPINCIEFDYYEKDGTEIFVPELLGSTETREIINRELSDKQKAYFDFFSKMLERFKEIKHVTDRKANASSHVSIPIGHGKYHLEWEIRGKEEKKLIVGLHLENNNKQENLKILNELKKHKDVFEEISPNVQFSEWVSNWAKVSIESPFSFSLNSGQNQEKVIEWGAIAMAEFYKKVKESGLFDKIINNLN